MRIRIEPYKKGSKSAKALSKRCKIFRTKLGRKKPYTKDTIIINWGNSERRFNGTYINDPANVLQASDKLAAYLAMEEAGTVPLPDFTTDRRVATKWLDDGYHVLVRKVLRGSKGIGITLVAPQDGKAANDGRLADAPLYVEYVKKATEYRIHIFGGDIIDVQQKKRNKSTPDNQVDWQVRNHDKGWIFARDGVVPPTCVLDAARAAVTALGLDFGAVDIGYNEKEKAATVYEVNTAPGLEGTTLEKYSAAILKRFPRRKAA